MLINDVHGGYGVQTLAQAKGPNNVLELEDVYVAGAARGALQENQSTLSDKTKAQSPMRTVDKRTRSFTTAEGLFKPMEDTGPLVVVEPPAVPASSEPQHAEETTDPTDTTDRLALAQILKQNNRRLADAHLKNSSDLGEYIDARK